MKKILIILLAVFFILICLILLISFKKNNSNNSTSFKSIKDALFTKSLSLKCIYSDKNNKQSQVFLDKNAAYIEGLSEEEKNTRILVKDNKMWFWDNQRNEGFIIGPEKSNLFIKNKKITSTNDIISALEPEKQNCQIIKYEDYFTVPIQVVFQTLKN